MAHSIHHDLVIKAPISKVFAAISEPEQLEHWWPLKCEGKPEEGATYNLFFGPEYNWFGVVTHIEPNISFHIKMTKSDADWDPTSFGFDLKETELGVKLGFWHVGWPECNTHFKRSSYCWAMLLKGLKDYLEKGIIVPFEDRE